LDDSVADGYKTIFSTHINELHNMLSNMGQMSLKSQDEGMAVYELSNRDGTRSCPVVFTTDDNGNWKIIVF
jgi:hypothetical protein